MKHSEKIDQTYLVAIILVTLIFLAGLFFLAATYRNFRRQSPFSPTNIRNFHHRPLTIRNIEGWMTFGFLNRSFNLPNAYLKKALGVNDKKYPNITLDRWAKESGTNPADLLEEIKLLISNYKTSASAHSSDAKNI